MHEVSLLLIVIVAVALAFDFTNGAHDCANAIATVVSTKVLSPRKAVIMAATLNLAGAFLGTEVAETVGKGIVRPEMITGCQLIVLSALVGAIIWNVLTWYLGIPSSSSHALVGGLMGAAVAFGGWDTLSYHSITYKVVLPLFLSPLAGMLAGMLFMLVLAWCVHMMNPGQASFVFRKLQILSSAFMATSHGMNDAQKTMGIITLALFLGHWIPEVTVPLWVKIACASIMGLGTMVGGWKIIKTMGHKIFKLEPVHGFAAETSAAFVITTASHFGAPISTTHVISASVMGVGAAKRLTAVRWGVAGNLLIAWVLTIPCSATIAGLFFLLFELAGLV
ncbi:MAG: inorganic phosphate transporter [Desulfarculus sp.]|nr:inorganic phosphate transporter [Desulfarculus sp.]